MTPLAPWQVRWARPGPVTGREQDGVRPVLVVSSPAHLAVTRGRLVTVVPITTADRGWPHHVPVQLAQPSFVMCEQSRTISADRLVDNRAVRTVDDPDVREAVIYVLGRMTVR